MNETKSVDSLEGKSESEITTIIKGHLEKFENLRRKTKELQHQSAVTLFRAGAALSVLRTKLKESGHGQWAWHLKTYGLKRTTVNDAIRLFENAKTEEALADMGITEAKKRFVYPSVASKPKQEDIENEGIQNKPKLFEPGDAREQVEDEDSNDSQVDSQVDDQVDDQVDEEEVLDRDQITIRISTQLCSVISLVEQIKKEGLWSQISNNAPINNSLKKLCDLIKAE